MADESTACKTLYLSNLGSDASDGASADRPIRTLERAVALLQNGATLLLAGGQAFEGSLALEGLSGVTVAGWGIGTPAIRSPHTALHLHGCTGCTVAGLALWGAGRTVLNGGVGLLAEGCEGLRLLGLEASGFHSAGISLKGCAGSEAAGCFAHDNGAVGIATEAFGGSWCRNIRIAHCKAYDNAGDPTVTTSHSGSGIIVAYTRGAVVEFCEAAGNGWAQRQFRHNGPVGIWTCCGAEDVVLRYNIARHNRTQPGTVDGDGMDFDGESARCLMEYNYTYENEGSGYLLCEFPGRITDTLWEDNTLRYCVSVNDDTMVPDYGALLLYAPEGIPFRRMRVHHNLLAAAAGLGSVMLKAIAPAAADLRLEGNLLVTDGAPAVDGESPQVAFTGNTAIEDAAVQRRLLQAAPRLTEPRALPGQPVFGLLEAGTAAEALRERGPGALFARPQPAAPAIGPRLLHLRLYGPDLEGCALQGDVALCHDSIRPGVATRLRGAGARVCTPIPSWEARKHYVIRAEARLQSPGVRAYLFHRDAEGRESRAYIGGTVAGYGFAQLPFAPETPSAADLGRVLGICLEGGGGAVFVHAVELLECAPPPEDADMPPLPLPPRSFGDGRRDGGRWVLEGPGRMEATLWRGAAAPVRLAATCTAGEAGGTLYLKAGVKQTAAGLRAGRHRVELALEVAAGAVDLGIQAHVGPAGGVTLEVLEIDGVPVAL